MSLRPPRQPVQMSRSQSTCRGLRQKNRPCLHRRFLRQIASDRVLKGLSPIPTTPAVRCVTSIGMHAKRPEQAGESSGGERVSASPLGPRAVLSVYQTVEQYIRGDDGAVFLVEHGADVPEELHEGVGILLATAQRLGCLARAGRPLATRPIRDGQQGFPDVRGAIVRCRW